MGNITSRVNRKEDLYTVLGLVPQASPEQIRQAYLDLARKYHPDKGGDHEMFVKIVEAYNTLRDPDGATSEKDWARMSAQDFFDYVDTQELKHHSAANAARPRLFDRICELEIEPNKLGGIVLEKVSRQVLKPGEMQRGCRKCGYTGEIYTIRGKGDDVTRFKVPCSCVPQASDLTRRQQETIEVPIPLDAKDGQKIRIPQKGDEFPGADPGDLVFIIRLKQYASALWERDGEHQVTNKQQQQHGHQQSNAPTSPAQKRTPSRMPPHCLGSSVVAPQTSMVPLEAGCRVWVKQTFRINKGRAHLQQGEWGTVTEIDKNGDAKIRFDRGSNLHCVSWKDFGKLEIVEKQYVAERDATTGLLKTPLMFSFEDL